MPIAVPSTVTAAVRTATPPPNDSLPPSISVTEERAENVAPSVTATVPLEMTSPPVVSDAPFEKVNVRVEVHGAHMKDSFPRTRPVNDAFVTLPVKASVAPVLLSVMVWSDVVTFSSTSGVMNPKTAFFAKQSVAVGSSPTKPM